MIIFETIFLSVALLVVIICGVKIWQSCREIDKILGDYDK